MTDQSMREQFQTEIANNYLPTTEGVKETHSFHRNVLADYLEECGFPEESACQRYLAKNNLRPYSSDKSDKAFIWFSVKVREDSIGDADSDLPDVLFDLLEGGTKIARHRVYKTAKEAEQAVVDAWHNLTEAQKRSL